ncbi:hypothetical protein AAMO2058_001027100 [Amorphochlora amoebiformis]
MASRAAPGATWPGKTAQIWQCIDDLEREIRCPICLSLCEDVQVLPCKHFFCKSCLGQHAMAAAYPDTPPADKRKSKKKRSAPKECWCPICKRIYERRKVKAEPTVVVLSNHFKELCDILGPRPQNRDSSDLVWGKEMEKVPSVTVKQAVTEEKIVGKSLQFEVPTPRAKRRGEGAMVGTANKKKRKISRKNRRKGGPKASMVLETQISVFNDSGSDSDNPYSPCESDPNPSPDPNSNPNPNGKLEKGKKVNASLQSPQPPLFEGIGRKCTICRCGRRAGDPLVECGGCGMKVHQSCYGISDEDAKLKPGLSGPNTGRKGKEIKKNNLDRGDNKWRCMRCIYFAVGDEDGYEDSFKCVLCPNKDDVALKLTKSGNWIHVSCAMWHTGPKFSDPRQLDGIYDEDKIDTQRRTLVCGFCRDVGACLQCTFGRCTETYHVPCGFQNGIKFELRERGKKVFFHSFCQKHAKESKKVISDNSTPSHRRPRKKRHLPEPKPNREPKSAPNSTPKTKPTRKRRGGGSASKNQRAKERKKEGCGLILTCTGLLPKHKQLVQTACKKFGMTLSNRKNGFSSTHIITSARKQNGYILSSRTMKYFQGMITGAKVLSLEWIEESLKHGRLMRERPYWVLGDPQGGGAKKARDGAVDRKIFKGWRVLFSGDMKRFGDKQMLADLIRKGGGETVESLGDLVESIHFFLLRVYTFTYYISNP